MSDPVLHGRTWSRTRTYLTVVGSVAAVVGAVAVLPATLGSSPSSTRSAAGPQPTASASLTTPDPSSSVTPTGTPVPGASTGAPGASTGPGASQGASATSTATSGSTTQPPNAGNPITDHIPRTASDVGVTPTTVTLGVVLASFGTENGVGGGVTGYSPKEQVGYFNDYVADVNARGGVGGRTIKVVTRTADITSQASSKAACDSLTDTDHAFAVTNVLGVYGPPILCFTQTHQRPYIANDGAVSAYYGQSHGRLFTLQPSTYRTQRNMAYELFKNGELKKGDRIGVLREDGYLTADEKSLESYVSGKGGKVVDAIMSSSDITQYPAQAQVAAQRFCSAGVTKVLLAVNTLYAGQFVNDVNGQIDCAPAYYTSDFDFQMDGDTFVSGMPAAYFTHARGISSSTVGNVSSGHGLTPNEKHCLAIYSRAQGKVVPPTDEHAIRAIAACGLVEAFVNGLEHAGPNPTRASFVTGLTAAGQFDNPGYSTSTFRQGKTDAPDQVREVIADGTCKCWKTVGNGMFHTALFD